MSSFEYVIGKTEGFHSCNCVGPQQGMPLCPCAMRSVRVQDGRYVQVRDLGPVKLERPAIEPIRKCGKCTKILPPYANFCPSCGEPA
jgi:hypothetical protein